MKITPLLIALVATAWISPARADDDPQLKRGEMLFMQCRICHSIKAGEPNRMGPNLSGIFGAKSAMRAGYNYSPAMKASGLTWDTATLDRYLTSPAKTVPGTRMGFGGIAAPADRAAVIAYLRAADK